MSPEIITALVALIISLIALITALLQLTQALFGTAEGYKRCAESVIGHWEGLRCRSFHATELRFEVRYITPQILLVSPEAKQWLEHKYNEHSPRETDEDHVHILHENVIAYKYHRVREQLAPQIEAASRWWRKRMHPWHYSNKLRVLHSTISGKQIGENHRTEVNEPKPSTTMDTLPLVIGPQKRPTHLRFMYMTSPGTEYEMRVSWDTFLQEICSVYTHYGDHPSVQNTPQGRQQHENTYPHILDIIERNRPTEGTNFARTDAAVTFRQWSWDMMPPDVVRPLATIAVGHLVILAVRLGMQWRVLNLEAGMSADGHGYSLSGVKSDKLGFMFKLIAMGVKDHSWRLIPNKAVDKLICGKLPGCPTMVKRDFDFIDNSKKSLLDLSRALDPDHILMRIGVPRPARDMLQKGTSRNWDFPSIHNEIVPLLCAFLPLKGSTAVRHYAHCWRENQRSVFHLWEGRFMILHCLEEAVKATYIGPDDPTGLKETLNFLRQLQNDFPEDFFGLKNGKAIDKSSSSSRSTSKEADREALQKEGEARRIALVDLCRRAHRWTDARFQALGLKEEDEQGRTQYENLVAAHLNMATYATSTVYNQNTQEGDLPSCPLDDAKIPDKFHPVLQRIRALDPRIRPPWVVCRLLENTSEYIECMRVGEHTIATYLRQRGSQEPVPHLTAAWWMLMLRGIVWDMSTLAHCWGEPIPASFYDNHVPVWIT